MILTLPSVVMDEKNSCLINTAFFPYVIDCYGEYEENGIRTLKVVVDEIKDLIHRYALVLPNAIDTFDTETYLGFKCLVNDEISGITRGILERIGYKLEESDFTPYGLYWITLQTRVAKEKKK